MVQMIEIGDIEINPEFIALIEREPSVAGHPAQTRVTVGDQTFVFFAVQRQSFERQWREVKESGGE